MWASYSAELLKLRKRPAIWVLAGVWLSLEEVFGYLIPYVSYASGDTGGRVTDGLPPEQLLASTLPANLVGNSTAGLPMFLGAIAVILGALVVGSEYGWGTLKMTLTQRPRRLSVYGGTLLALGSVTAGLVLLTFCCGAVSSWVIASVEARPVDWPSVANLAQGVVAGWLIATVWVLFGAALALLLRGVALAVGLGLVWTMAVENLIANIGAPALDLLATLNKGLPGANAGALAAALATEPIDTPGVAAIVGGTQAALVLVGYVVLFAVVGGVVLHRRDVS